MDGFETLTFWVYQDAHDEISRTKTQIGLVVGIEIVVFVAIRIFFTLDKNLVYFI